MSSGPGREAARSPRPGGEGRGYILGAGESERTRLLAQAGAHRPEAGRLLERVELRPGARVLDLGCGPLGVLDLLSAAIGPAGEAIGLDNEPRMIAYAEETIAALGLANVTLVLGDATRTGLAGGSVDLAHARLVLINHPAPADIVAEMIRVTRPGGWVVLQEAELDGWTCEPPHPAWGELLRALREAWSAAGLDPLMGRHLPGLLREHGLIDVAFDAHAHLWPPEHPFTRLLLRMVDIFRGRIVASDLLGADRLAHLTGELERHLAQPGCFVIHPLLFQAWGRKPL